MHQIPQPVATRAFRRRSPGCYQRLAAGCGFCLELAALDGKDDLHVIALTIPGPRQPSDMHAPFSSVIPLHKLHPNPFQPRVTFRKEKLLQLAASLKADGFLQPVIVRATGDDECPFQIVDGERRRRAAALAKLETAPCVIREVSDDEMALLALIANDLREELDPIERALSYQRLLDSGMSQVQLAKRLSRSKSAVNYTVRLLELPEEWREKIVRGEISYSSGCELLSAVRTPGALAEISARLDRLAPAPAAEAMPGENEFARRGPGYGDVCRVVRDVMGGRGGAVQNGSPPDSESVDRSATADADGMRPVRTADDRREAYDRAAPRLEPPAASEAALDAWWQRWLADLLARELERRGVAGVLKAIGVNLADAWRHGPPDLYEFLDLHSKPELIALAADWGAKVDPAKTRDHMIRQLMSDRRIREKLPAELAALEPRGGEAA